MGYKMSDIKLWVILLVSIGSLCYTIISTFAIRGNELKHIKSMVLHLEKMLNELEQALLKRIERLEQRFFNKGDS